MADQRRVLLAEDDGDIRELVARTLEADFDVDAVGTGTACWERLQSGPPPDALLLDVMLPGMDGLEVLERIREDDRLSGMPVLVLTGRDEAELEERIDDDVAGYVSKPFSPADLQDRLRGLVD